MFSRWSNQKVQFYSLLIILGGILAVLSVMTLTSSLSCIDEDGCLKYSCAYHRFDEEYIALIDMSINNNPKCCWKRYSLQNQCVGGYDNEAFYDNNSCQSDVNKLVIERTNVEDQTKSIDLEPIVKAALTDLQTLDAANLVNPLPDAVSQPVEYQNWLNAAKSWVMSVDYVALDSNFAADTTIISNAVLISDTSCQTEGTVVSGQNQLDTAIKTGNQILATKQFFEEANFNSNFNKCEEIWKNNVSICICPKVSQEFTDYVANYEKLALDTNNLVRGEIKDQLEKLKTDTDAALLPVNFDEVTPELIDKAAQLVKDATVASGITIPAADLPTPANPPDISDCPNPEQALIDKKTKSEELSAAVNTSAKELVWMETNLVNSCDKTAVPKGFWSENEDFCKEVAAQP